MQIPSHSVVTIPTKRTGKCDATTPCIFEVDVDEIISIQNLQLITLPTVHLKDEVEPQQVPLTFIKLLYDTVQVAKHTVIGFLWLYAMKNYNVLKYTS